MNVCGKCIWFGVCYTSYEGKRKNFDHEICDSYDLGRASIPQRNVYIAACDNGYNYGRPEYEQFALGAFTDRVYAELCLRDHGFSERDSHGNYWHGRELGWIDVLPLQDSYTLGGKE